MHGCACYCTMNIMFLGNAYFTGERVVDIAFWKSELLNEITSVETETQNLEVLRMCDLGVW